ncbi:MAG: hypothetical protein HYZ53_28180 [Planctomycetes bacterium]|nr:hypothetical protein [Planctomycetota bacterium]
MIEFGCPRCGYRFQLEDSHAWRKSRCGKCGTRFLVPTPGGSPKLLPDKEEAGETGSAAADGPALKPAARTKRSEGGKTKGLRVKCSCGQAMSIPERKLGKLGKCPACGTSFRALAADAQPAQATDTHASEMEALFGPDEPADAPAGGARGASEKLFPTPRPRVPPGEVPLLPDLPPHRPAARSGGDATARVVRFPPPYAVGPAAGTAAATATTGGAPPLQVPGFSPKGRVGRGRGAASDKAPLGFAALLLGTIVRPFSTMEHILYHLGQWDTMLRMALFYVASLVMVATLAGRRADAPAAAGGGPAPTAGRPASSGGIGTEEIPRFANGQSHELGNRRIEFTTDPHPLRAGDAGELRYRIVDTTDQAPYVKGIKGCIIESESGGEGEGGAAASSALLAFLERPGSGEYRLKTSRLPSPGTYRVLLVFSGSGGNADLRFEHDFEVRDSAEAESRGTKQRGKWLFAIVVVGLASSVIFLLIDALILNVAARLLGGGGGFLGLLVVLAYLTGITNFSSVALLLVGGKVTPSFAKGLEYALLAWNRGLFLLALMKVYDLELTGALTACAVSGVIRVWVAGSVAALLFGLLA